MTTTLREKHHVLEQEVVQYRHNVKSLQERLDRVSKVIIMKLKYVIFAVMTHIGSVTFSHFLWKDFHMDVEDLSEVLMQIKVGLLMLVR